MSVVKRARPLLPRVAFDHVVRAQLHCAFCRLSLRAEVLHFSPSNAFRWIFVGLKP
jgi:hypothetical protein